MNAKFLKNGIYSLNYEENEPNYAIILDIIDTTYNGKPVMNYQIYTIFTTASKNTKLQKSLESDIFTNKLNINEYHQFQEIALEYSINGYIGQCQNEICEKLKNYYHKYWTQYGIF